MKAKKNRKAGFTLIELSFAVAFISILVITITLITNEIISLYRKGYAIKTINQVGRSLIDDITDSVQSSPPANLTSFCRRYTDKTSQQNCEKNHALYSIYQQYYYDKVKINNDKAASRKVPIGGIFCTGKYTYIWNTGYLFGDEYSNSDTKERLNQNKGLRLSVNINGKLYQDFHLLKVEDSTRAICASTITSYPNSSSSPSPPSNGGQRVFKLDKAPTEEPKELLIDSDTSLALYDLVIFPPAQVDFTNRLFYSGSFILGTIEGGVNIMTSSDFCQSPNMFSADFSYCAINKFNFGIQASDN